MERPIVGICLIILNEDLEVLLGLRKSKLGNHKWGLPGGKLELLESFEDCIVRETKEETNLIIDKNDLVYLGITNDIIDENSHYITLFYSTTIYNGELKINEPDKCFEWKWFNVNDLPNNLFKPLQNFLDGNIL